MGADGPGRRALDATHQDQPSLVAASLPRQTPEAGAEYVSSACSDLSGGRKVKPASLPVMGEAQGAPVRGVLRLAHGHRGPVGHMARQVSRLQPVEAVRARFGQIYQPKP